MLQYFHTFRRVEQPYACKVGDEGQSSDSHEHDDSGLVLLIGNDEKPESLILGVRLNMIHEIVVSLDSS